MENLTQLRQRLDQMEYSDEVKAELHELIDKTKLALSEWNKTLNSVGMTHEWSKGEDVIEILNDYQKLMREW